MLDHDTKDGQNVTVADDATAIDQVAGERAAADVVPDPELLAARALGRQALEEITEARSIGAEAGHEVHEERVVTLFFECRMAGYPGWHWAATLTKVDASAAVNVLEVELLPGEGAVVAPDWVPWSERLAQFRETQAQQADEAADAKAAASELADEDDAEDSLLDNDFSDFDDEIDGVDIDSEDGDDDESDDNESDDDDSDDDDSDDDSDDDDDDDDSDDDDSDDE